MRVNMATSRARDPLPKLARTNPQGLGALGICDSFKPVVASYRHRLQAMVPLTRGLPGAGERVVLPTGSESTTRITSHPISGRSRPGTRVVAPSIIGEGNLTP